MELNCPSFSLIIFAAVANINAQHERHDGFDDSSDSDSSNSSKNISSGAIIGILVGVGFVIFLLIIVPWIIKKYKAEMSLRQRSAQQVNTVRQNLPVAEKRSLSSLIGDQRANCNEYSISEQKACSICLADFTKGEYLIKTKCDHLFHIKCLDDWAEHTQELTCPVCRKEVSRPVN